MSKEFAKGAAAGALAVAVAGAALFALRRSPSAAEGEKASPDKPSGSSGVAAASADEPEVEASTTSNTSGAVYETKKAVSEYVMFHYGAPSDILPYEDGPHNALEFPKRTADICASACRKYGVDLRRALDVGCAVGAASFHLASHFESVVGVDFSHAFVAAAESLQKTGKAPYTCVIESDISKEMEAVVPAGIDRTRCTFAQGDACNLSPSLGKFSVIHGSNLLCRLPEPEKFLDSLDSFLDDNGLVVLVSPYSWLPGYTPREKWVGGYVEAGKPQYSRRGLLDIMEAKFKLVEESNVPFLIREHARKFQYGVSHLTIFQKR